MPKYFHFIALLLLSGFYSLAIAEDLAAIAQQQVRDVMAKVDKIDSDSLKMMIDKGKILYF